MDLPFKGLHVLDWGQGIEAPYCAKLFGDLGADVIKIEPLEGDRSRRWGPFPKDLPHLEKSGIFLFLNTSKRGVTLNAENPSGQELLLQLAAWADILVENWAPAAFDTWGFSRDVVREANPELVLASITPFGLTGPYKDYLATELGVHALSGELSVAGLPDQPPLRKGGEAAQYFGGLHAFIAATSTLFTREESGNGGHIDVSLAEGLTAINGMSMRTTAYLNRPATRRAGLPWPMGIFPSKDGHVVAFPRGGSNWQADFEEIMRQTTGGEQSAARGVEGESLQVRFNRWMQQHTKDEIYRETQKRRQAFGPVATATDLLESKQLRHRRYFQRVDHPDAGAVSMIGLPFLLDGERQQVTRAPRLGEHNEAVYCGMLGLSRSDLVVLRRAGVA